MPASIAFNMSNVVTGTNNSTYTYNFPSTVHFKEGDKVALQNLAIYYSWQNITSAYDNNAFSYIWNGAVVSTVSVTLPNGSYTIQDINAYLQSVMVANDQYLINGTGDFVYYLEVVPNTVLNAFQINSYPIPTALPAGWSAPAGWAGYPAVAATPQIVIPATNIQTLLGFTAATYPAAPQATAYSAVSDSTPQISTVTSVYLMCNLVKNTFTLPNQILYSFAPNATFGAQIQVVPPYPVYNTIQVGGYSSITIQFLDQNFNFLQITDSNISVLLAIRTKEEAAE